MTQEIPNLFVGLFGAFRHKTANMKDWRFRRPSFWVGALSLVFEQTSFLGFLELQHCREWSYKWSYKTPINVPGTPEDQKFRVQY